MTAAAAAVAKEAFSGKHDRFARFPTVKPLLIINRLHHHDPTDHSRMVCAAVLRAKKMILAGQSRLEPFTGVFAWDDILFRPKGWDEKTVDHILGSHRQGYGSTGRHVQLIDLALAFGVLQFPHPLLGYHVNLGSIVGRAIGGKVNPGAPAEHH